MGAALVDIPCASVRVPDRSRIGTIRAPNLERGGDAAVMPLAEGMEAPRGRRENALALALGVGGGK